MMTSRTPGAKALAILAIAHCLITRSNLARAQSLGDGDRLNQVLTCQVWREYVTRTIDRLIENRLRDAADVVPAQAVVDLLGRRCATDDPRRITALFGVVQDLLADAKTRP